MDEPKTTRGIDVTFKVRDSNPTVLLTDLSCSREILLHLSYPRYLYSYSHWLYLIYLSQFQMTWHCRLNGRYDVYTGLSVTDCLWPEWLVHPLTVGSSTDLYVFSITGGEVPHLNKIDYTKNGLKNFSLGHLFSKREGGELRDKTVRNQGYRRDYYTTLWLGRNPIKNTSTSNHFKWRNTNKLLESGGDETRQRGSEDEGIQTWGVISRSYNSKTESGTKDP